MEDQLWKAIRNNDKEAFTTVYKAYYQFLFTDGFRTCANKDLIKDCIHELFLEVWHNRASLKPVQHIGAYLKTYLRRKIQKEILKLQQLYTGDITEADLQDVEYSYEDMLIRLQSRTEMAERVKAAMQQLSQRQIAIIKMRFFDNKSYDEIAALTTTTPRTVYNHVYDSLKILRRCLKFILPPLGF